MQFSRTDPVSGVLVESTPDYMEYRPLQQEKLFSCKDDIRRRTLKKRAEAYDGALNLSVPIDWGEPIGSELW